MGDSLQKFVQACKIHGFVGRVMSEDGVSMFLRNVAIYIQGVQLKSGPCFNISNLFTKIYNMYSGRKTSFLKNFPK